MSAKQITKDSLIPLSLVGAIGIGIWWASGLNGRVEANTKDISRVENTQEKYSATVEQIGKDIAVIKTEIQRVREKR